MIPVVSFCSINHEYLFYSSGVFFVLKYVYFCLDKLFYITICVLT